MKKLVLFIVGIMMISTLAQSQITRKRESYYQEKFAIIMKGQKEVTLDDQTRVDILTDTFAIEVDFAEKWSQSIGQTLYYSQKLNKKAGILLVVNGIFDDKYVKRLMTVAYKHNITVWIMDYNDESWGRVDVDIKYIY